jgi:uncharacterized protein YraI
MFTLRENMLPFTKRMRKYELEPVFVRAACFVPFRSGGVSMRLLVAILATCTFMAVPQAISAQPAAVPYKAYAKADGVCVRSGPGQNYYPTDRLKIGQEVEVYRDEPAGWCAIRPIEGSFSWVSSRYLKPTEGNLAVVTGDKVEACIGSHLNNDARPVSTVHLRKGETVEIFDSSSNEKMASKSDWIKIAPPSGEFRWIAVGDIDRNPPDHTAAAAARPVSGQIEEAATPATAPPGSPLSAHAYQKELDRLDLELSAMVIEEPSAWSFDGLRDRANWLVDHAQTAVERGRARLLVNKITRFDDIKHRYDAVQAMHENNERSARLLANLRSDVGPRPAIADIDDRFDGVGQLAQVTSAKQGAPRYALVDDSGSLRCYVTPAPGVNLQSYVGKQVGITGTRGYLPEQRAGHLMARHVTLLNSQVARSTPPIRPRSVVR